jgi:type I restriction enzyme M protein
MLDNETKRRIDTARDILVGKVPDPKSQVEQITIALIYKFMDDMDLEAEELGGHPNFFTGEYEKYGWRKIFDPALGGHEMLGLYGDAITRMALNPNLPQLFRDIFKNAYLPYRDPETLKSFLKIIDDFNYDQSEKLGDAFEYLLSVLGSQGDAGQFRTPRHIIDFMTAILDPRKTDTILDPACGTAGFLISAYKHILDAHSSGNTVRTRHGVSQQESSGDFVGPPHGVAPRSPLTPNDRTRITSNIRGYDISPDMVRLSLVNLYLHGFPEPHIYEYDSLTSEDRWNEFYDVILANPPFMSPKGGIRPHKRFSVQSNRSEVLFVDLMAEHLTPGGRAAIVVPEGIIFQSGTAYKSLRKMLVDDYLVGVISLPAGVFNPYSGVKTSILWLDKSLARKTNQILFAKITADGFDLGAQRRPVKQNDLPGAFRAIQQYIDFLQIGSISADSPIDGVSSHGVSLQDSNDNFVRPPHGVAQQSPESTLQSIYPHLALVAKSAIAENGDYNLSGERYKEVNDFSLTKVKIVELSEIAKIEYGFTEKAKDEGDVRFIRITDINERGELKEEAKYIDLTDEARKYLLYENDILVARTGATFGKTLLYSRKEPAVFASFLIRIRLDQSQIIPKYYWSFAQSDIYWRQANSLMTGGGQPQFNGNALKQIQIPLPPLSIQQEIVAEIEAYQKVIDGARQVVENYKPRITIDPDWKMVELGEVCEIRGGYAFQSSDYVGNGVQLIRMGNVKSMFFDYQNSPSYLPEKYAAQYSNFLLRKGDILISMTGTIGKEDYGNVCRIDIDGHFLLNQRVGKFEINIDKLDPSFIYYFSNSEQFRRSLFGNSSGGVRQANISNKGIESIIIPLPPLEIQQQIVAQIEREQALVNASKELIALFEQKIKDRIARVWGE